VRAVNPFVGAPAVAELCTPIATSRSFAFVVVRVPVVIVVLLPVAVAVTSKAAEVNNPENSATDIPQELGSLSQFTVTVLVPPDEFNPYQMAL